MTVSLWFHQYTSGQQDVRSSVPLPIVYDSAPEKPVQWEYKVLSIDTREEALPDNASFNDLGAQGWLLAGVLNTAASQRNEHVHYYFVRQLSE